LPHVPPSEIHIPKQKLEEIHDQVLILYSYCCLYG
jgi:hypothetical protein